MAPELRAVHTHDGTGAAHDKRRAVARFAVIGAATRRLRRSAAGGRRASADGLLAGAARDERRAVDRRLKPGTCVAVDEAVPTAMRLRRLRIAAVAVAARGGAARGRRTVHTEYSRAARGPSRQRTK